MNSFTSPEQIFPEPIRPNRRDVLRGVAHGFGAIAMQSMLAKAGLAKALNPLAAKPQHFPAKAKSVIFLFMVGAPSHIDTFDPKPQLKEFEGQKLPDSFGKVVSQFTDGTTPLLACPWKFKQYGQSGLPVPDLFPHIAQCVDDICFVRDFQTDMVSHAPSIDQ